MLKKLTRPKTMMLAVVILSSLLTISASGSFFYRNAVLGYETQKTLLLDLNLSYNYLWNSLQEHAYDYVQTGNEKSLGTFRELKESYEEDSSIHLAYQPISEYQAYTWLSDYLRPELFNMSYLASRLDLKEEERQSYQLLRATFAQSVGKLEKAVESKAAGDAAELDYFSEYYSFNYYMYQLSGEYLERINRMEDESLKYQNFFGYLSLFLSLTLAGTGALLAYTTIITNRNNSYYRQLFSATVENADFGMAILGPDYEYRYMNNQYRQILRIRVKDPVGKSPMELLPADFTNNIARPLKADDELVNSTITINQWEEPRHINVSRFPVRDENGQVNYVSIVRDITDRVNLEQQLKRQLEETEFHSRAKDAFLANISHEIKTPLNAIIGLSQVLRETELSHRQRSIVGRISSSSDLLLNLINDVLDFSKIRSTEFKLYPQKILLTNLLSEVEGIATALIGSKSVLWCTEYEYSPGLCIITDKTRLTQVFLNLINNASKFTEEGQIRLIAETIEEGPDSVTLQFTIRDTGIGMDEREMGRLFREFEQLENTLTKRHQGTGLGLIITKRIIEAMGGSIFVASTKGEGSAFSFRIPFAKASTEEYLESLEATEEPQLEGCGRRVLVVEDNPINYEVIESLLEKAGIRCENASDGLVCLEMCKSNPKDYYHLILMDIHMPRMDGYEASRILREEMGMNQPIIALTATNVDEESRAKNQNIIDDYILKPFHYMDLFNTLSPHFPHGENPFRDRAAAIENLGGMVNLYEKHLGRFRENYEGAEGEIRRLLETGEREEAHRLAHSIKGLAGTLGLPYLQSVSADLEGYLKNTLNEQLPPAEIQNPDSDLNQLLEQFGHRMKQVCQSEQQVCQSEQV